MFSLFMFWTNHTLVYSSKKKCDLCFFRPWLTYLRRGVRWKRASRKWSFHNISNSKRESFQRLWKSLWYPLFSYAFMPFFPFLEMIFFLSHCRSVPPLLAVNALLGFLPPFLLLPCTLSSLLSSPRGANRSPSRDSKRLKSQELSPWVWRRLV